LPPLGLACADAKRRQNGVGVMGKQESFDYSKRDPEPERVYWVYWCLLVAIDWAKSIAQRKTKTKTGERTGTVVLTPLIFVCLFVTLAIAITIFALLIVGIKASVLWLLGTNS
jgi:hypothetical protein